MGVVYKLLKHRYNHHNNYYSCNYNGSGNDNDNNNNSNNNNYISNNVIAISQQQSQQWRHQQSHNSGGSNYTKDLVKSKLKTRVQMRRTITLEGHIIEQPLLRRQQPDGMAVLPQTLATHNTEVTQPSMDHTTSATTPATLANADAKEFTDEHVLKLCEFLAERAKNNKHLCKPHQRLQQQHQIEIETAATPEPFSTKNENERRFATISTSVLALRTSSIEVAVMASSSPQKWSKATKSPFQPQRTTLNSQNGGKRDILLKIRQQIFERKRKRQLAAHMQQTLGVVWRPW